MDSSELTSPPPSQLFMQLCPHGLPASADHLVNQLSVFCEGLLGAAWSDSSENHDLFHRRFCPPQQFLEFSRTPQPSALGFASLLLGISSTLLCLGSFAFLLGLMLMPFILPLAFVATVGVLLAGLKSSLLDLRSFFPSSSASLSNDPIVLAKLGF